MNDRVEAIRQDHERGCAVCYYTTDGPCSVAVLLDELDGRGQSDAPTKMLVRVTWGLVPGHPDGMREWSLTAEQAKDPEEYNKAVGAGASWMLGVSGPDRSNWATMEWVWL